MNIKQALAKTGFTRCEFKSDGQERCDRCDKKIKRNRPVFYRRTCYEVDEGEYYCKSCMIVLATGSDTETYICSGCGGEDTRFKGGVSDVCFSCFANREIGWE